MAASAIKPVRTTPRGRRTRLLWAAALGVVAWMIPPPCPAQQTDLNERLKDLRVRLRTEHYVFAGSVNEGRFAQYGQALEYIYREYEQGFSGLLKKEPAKTKPKAKKRTSKRSRKTKPATDEDTTTADEPVETPAETMDAADPQSRFRVIIFSMRKEYDDFGTAYLGGNEFSIGKFVPSCDLLLILDQGNFADTYEVLFHEAFHQFMHRHVKNPPTWLDEGLATHYGYARPTRNGLTFSRPPALYWKLTRKLISKRQALPLTDVVGASHSEFYATTPVDVSGYENVTTKSLHYAEAYTLVHLLLSDAGGRKRLQDYVRALAESDGRNTDAITREYFGPDVCEYLTPYWIKHVNSRPETR